MLNKLKKWNWTAFWVMLLAGAIGACGNPNIKSIKEGLIILGLFAVPLGLAFAWVTQDPE